VSVAADPEIAYRSAGKSAGWRRTTVSMSTNPPGKRDSTRIVSTILGPVAPVHLVDENHIPALQRDALIQDPHAAGSWIELHLEPETANTDEVSLGPPGGRRRSRSLVILRPGVSR